MAEGVSDRGWLMSGLCWAITLLAVWLTAGIGHVFGQTTEAGSTGARSIAYDVVSIRPNYQGPGSVRVSINLDVYAATNVSLVDLLQSAYSLRPGLLSGEPKWADSARFDIRAKTLDAGAEELKKLTPEDRQRMLQELLADRFHLQVHHEIKTLPVYELVVAKGGTNLKEIASADRNSPFHGVSSGGLSIHNGQLAGHYLTMSRIADTLSFQVNRTVLDKTELAGMYNFELTWTRDDAPAAEDTAAPSLFIALGEQLGLRLVATKAPVETLVVDHVEMPTEN